MAQRWIRQQAQAGRTAEQIAATDAYITGPLRERARTNEAAEETVRGWAEVVAGELARLREKPAAAAQQPEPQAGQMESEPDPFPARNFEPEEPVPEDGASWLAWPDDDYAREADAGGYSECDDWASRGEPPVELEPEAGGNDRHRGRKLG